MESNFAEPCVNTDLHEMTIDEVNQVSGAGIKEAAAAFGLAGAIGTAAYGSGWGAFAVGAAFGAAPIALIAMSGLAIWGGYKFMTK
jgi:hypothetical protein